VIHEERAETVISPLSQRAGLLDCRDKQDRSKAVEAKEPGSVHVSWTTDTKIRHRCAAKSQELHTHDLMDVGRCY